jgi:glycerate kinase
MKIVVAPDSFKGSLTAFLAKLAKETDGERWS